MTATQVCTACRQEKPIDDFYSVVRDGYKPARMTVCKACHIARVRRRTAERRKAKRPNRIAG